MLNGEWQNDRFLSGEIQRTVIDLTGEPQEKTVVPSVETVVVEPDVAKRLTKVTVLGVTSEIDENISPMNIRKGKTILGVEGNLEPDKPDQSKVVSPSVEEQVVRADTGYELASVTVGAVTSDIDENIQADNIRYGVEILGVVGTVEQKEDLDAELDEQDTLLYDLQSQVDILHESSIDLTQITATADDVQQGLKIYNADGELVEGTCQNIFQEYADTMGFQSLFSGYPTETIPYLNELDTSKATNMNQMFGRCDYLTSLDLSNFNTKNVTSMSYMFWQCPALESLDLSSFDTSNVTTMESMFRECGVKDININGLNTSNVTTMRGMFYKCDVQNIDISTFDMSKVTNMLEMFSSCKATTINVGDLKVSPNANLNSMFAYGDATTVNGTIDLVNMPNIGNIFYYSEVRSITLKNIKTNLTLGKGLWNTGGYGYSWSKESLTNTIQELWDNTDDVLGGTRTLSMSTGSKSLLESQIYVKLIDITDEMRAEDEYVDNKKPCVVCESTDEGAMTLAEYAISKNWVLAYA